MPRLQAILCPLDKNTTDGLRFKQNGTGSVSGWYPAPGEASSASQTEREGAAKRIARVQSFSAPIPKISLSASDGSKSARLPLLDRSGIERDSITETTAERLLALGLVHGVGRRKTTALMLRPGVSMAAIKAALRSGIRERLPVAEDNRTVRRNTNVGGQCYEPDHVAAWDDGRPLPEALRPRGDE